MNRLGESAAAETPTGFRTFGIPAAVAAAVRTGIFAEVLRGPVTPAELAGRLGLDLRAMPLVLDVLVTTDLLVRDGDRLVAGPALLATVDRPGGAWLELGVWGQLESFLRTGEPFVAMDQSAPEREQSYRTVAGELGKLLDAPARTLATRLPLHPRRVLDVGCGSGVWSLAIAQRFDDVHVTGLDLPAVLDNFASRAASLGLAARTQTIAGDMHEVAIPGGVFDLVVIANVLRLETPERAASVLARIAGGVAPGGALLVVDAIADGTPEGARAHAVYALHLGLRTRHGQVHSADAIASWLARAGLPQVHPIQLPTGAGAVGALLATK